MRRDLKKWLAKKEAETRAMTQEIGVPLWLVAGLLQNEADRMLPPPTPGRGKRQNGNRPQAIAIAESLEQGSAEPWISSLIDEAFATKDPSIFKAILQALKDHEGATTTKFNRAVMECRKAAAYLAKTTGELPEKSQVIDRVIEANGRNTFGKDEAQRWTEVFKAAGLTKLPKSAGKRGQTRHGNK